MTGKESVMTAQTEVLIPFHDVDSMGIVWHGHYVKYFEVVRCVLLDQIGFGYTAMAQSNWGWPVVECRSKFIAPLRFEQRIIARAKLVDWDLRLRIDYELCDAASGRCHTRGRTVQVAVDRDDGGLVLPLPSKVKQIIETAVSS